MLGDKIKYVCEVLLRDKTIIEIAAELKVNDNTIRTWYKKDSIETKHLLGLAKMAGISFTYFFEETQPVNVVNEGNANYITKNKGAINQEINKEEACWRQLAEANRELAEIRKKYIELIESK